MHRFPLTTCFFIIVVSLALVPSLITNAQQQSTSASYLEPRFVSSINGWVTTEEALQDYEIGTDSTVRHGGAYSAFARSKAAATVAKAITLRQSVKADAFRGHYVRLSGWLKGEKIEEWAALWLRIDGEQGMRFSLDNMQNRCVKGSSDWQRYELILDVPEQAIAVSFGLVLVGKGQAWMDDLRLDQVAREGLTTETHGKSQRRPDDNEYNHRRESFAKRLLEELKTKSALPINLDFETPAH